MLQSVFHLNNGCDIPSIGLGTWNAKGSFVEEAVEYACKIGYRHIDCASIYGNEKEIGVAFRNIFSTKMNRRNDFFITSKLWNNCHRFDDVIKSCKKTLSDLNLEYLDLYLIHWAIAFVPGNDNEPLDTEGFAQIDKTPVQETWRAMEELVRLGLVKSIGVANFNTQSLLDLLTHCNIPPTVNQIELHPYNTQVELLQFMSKLKIHTTGYSPLGTPGKLKADSPVLLNDPVLINIAKKYKKTPAQILINWEISRGSSVIPKSINKKRLEENLWSLDFELTAEDIVMLTNLNKNHRFVNPVGWWKVPYFC